MSSGGRGTSGLELAGSGGWYSVGARDEEPAGEERGASVDIVRRAYARCRRATPVGAVTFPTVQGGRRRAARRTVTSTVALGLSVLALGACVGSISGGEFDDEVRSRGGGLDGDLVADAVDAIEADVGVDEVRVRSVDVSPGYVVVQVQVPSDPDELDTYRFGAAGRYGGRGLSGPHPVARGAGEPPLDTQVFVPEAAGIGRLDDMVDQAIEAADLPGGWAEGASVRMPPGGGAGPVTTVTVTNDRRTVTVTFAAEGTLLEVAAR